MALSRLLSQGGSQDFFLLPSIDSSGGERKGFNCNSREKFEFDCGLVSRSVADLIEDG